LVITTVNGIDYWIKGVRKSVFQRTMDRNDLS
jgi:hypothetical protein